jgi:PQQ-like domain
MYNIPWELDPAREIDLRLWEAVAVSAIVALGLVGCGSGSSGGGGGDTVPATITVQPTNQTVTAPAPATFTSAATGTPAPTYQWQMEPPGGAFANIAGATSSSYTTPATSSANNGEMFRVSVANSTGAQTSAAVTLTVNSTQTQPATITVQPTNQTVTAPAAATFTVTATGTPAPTYQWQMEPAGGGTFSDIAGATSSSYTTPATSSADNGEMFRVNVTNPTGSPTSSAATLTVNTAQASNVTVLTYHNDNGRTGQNLNETTLTTANVASAQFGMLGSMTVDGPVDAEPLYVGGVTINGATHNVVFVATENDSVYAFDADSFAQLWHNAVLNGTGETPSDTRGCGQVEPTIGITSTPAIDLNAGPNGTIFVVAMSKAGGTYHQRLHALDLTTGADRMAATDIQAATFVPGQYEERTGLLLANGVVYLAWTSHCDSGSYNAWVMGFAESSLQQTSTINLTPHGNGGGIWMAGDGLAADASNNIYFLDGNGTFDTTLNNGFPSSSDYGNAFLKLSTTNSTLAVSDYFEMFDTVNQSNNDRDLGSGGALLLPDMQDSGGTTRHLAVGAGKADANSGNVMLYVVDRDNMGKFNPNNDNAIYQEISTALQGGQGVWAAPAYFNNTVYYAAVNDTLKAFPITQARLATSASSQSSSDKNPITFGYPGATPSISADGSTNPPTNGIVWAIEGATTLTAFDATNLGNELFSGVFPGNGSTKFITPMIANGKVYVGTGSPNANVAGTVVVFGLTTQEAGLVRKPNAARERRRWLQAPKAPRPGSSTPGE